MSDSEFGIKNKTPGDSNLYTLRDREAAEHHERQRALEERLWSVIGELSSVNEYEYPYRIPQLQLKADRLLEELSGPPKDIA